MIENYLLAVGSTDRTLDLYRHGVSYPITKDLNDWTVFFFI
jgi:hypothetical protein